MKQQIAQSARDNPVSHPMCIGCEHKKKKKTRRKRVGIIVTDLMGGDACYQIVSAKDFKAVCEFSPTKRWMVGTEHEKEVFDTNKYQHMVNDYLKYNKETEEYERVIKTYYTQTFVPEDMEMSKYNIIGMLTLSEC